MPGERTGQRRVTEQEPTLRGRVSSGLLIGGVPPLVVAERIRSLHALVHGIGECWAHGVTAAALHGFDGFPLTEPFHVVVRRGRSVQRIGHHIHTSASLRPIDVATVCDVPTTSATRTIIDLAASEPPARLAAAIDSATRDRTTSDDFLYRQLVALRSQGRKGVTALLGVLAGTEITRGGHSWLEREFLRLLVRARLPRPAVQQVVGARKGHLIRVDCRFPGTPIVVELLGYSFHRTVMQMQDDAARANRMLLDGLLPLQFTFTDVVERPDDVVRTIAEALARCAGANTVSRSNRT